jgi:polynucleotide 5'-kinase involved in rRNA processing
VFDRKAVTPAAGIEKHDSMPISLRAVCNRYPLNRFVVDEPPFFVGRPANEKELEILSRLAEAQVHYAEWGHRTVCLVVSKPLSKATITHIKDYLSLTSVTAEIRAYFEHRLVGLISSASGNTDAIGVIEAVDFQKREFSIRCKTDAAQHACAIQLGDYKITLMPN